MCFLARDISGHVSWHEQTTSKQYINKEICTSCGIETTSILKNAHHALPKEISTLMGGTQQWRRASLRALLRGPVFEERRGEGFHTLAQTGRGNMKYLAEPTSSDLLQHGANKLNCVKRRRTQEKDWLPGNCCLLSTRTR